MIVQRQHSWYWPALYHHKSYFYSTLNNARCETFSWRYLLGHIDKIHDEVLRGIIPNNAMRRERRGLYTFEHNLQSVIRVCFRVIYLNSYDCQKYGSVVHIAATISFLWFVDKILCVSNFTFYDWYFVTFYSTALIWYGICHLFDTHFTILSCKNTVCSRLTPFPKCNLVPSIKSPFPRTMVIKYG